MLSTDVIKTQVQTSREGNQKFWATFKNILQTRGVQGLYMGYWVTVLRAVPSNALLFVSYEATKRLINFTSYPYRI
jgi:solute carrier family 25 carnitine/acylcarnitine transporter 20/29